MNKSNSNENTYEDEVMKKSIKNYNKGLNMLATRLKKLRGKKTQQQLADKLRLDRTAISKYENGSATPPLQTLYLFAAYFNTTVAYLLGDQQSM